MTLPSILILALMVMACLGVFTWIISLLLNDVSIVDSVWPLLILLATLTYILRCPFIGPRALIVVVLVALWSLRLSAHITWRHWGQTEDRRYQAIRARNAPYFPWKSLVLVFGLQVLLAWIVSLSTLGAIINTKPWHLIDTIAACIVMAGTLFEAIADWQLARFKSDPAHEGLVMDRGLWRLSRHPNYFGEFCVWWGFYLLTLSTHAWWAIASPVLVSILLLKVSGVSLQEKTIAGRRPGYQDYVNRTNAFFPDRPKQSSDHGRQSID